MGLSSISHIRGALDELFQGFLKGKRTLEESNNISSSVLVVNELRFVEYVLSNEFGYVRYDYDKSNEMVDFIRLTILTLTTIKKHSK